MAKNKKPRHISQKDWDAFDSAALSDDILAAMKPAPEAFPDLAEESARRKRGERGPQKKPRKVLISLRVERSTIEAYKATGRGYQTRMPPCWKSTPNDYLASAEWAYRPGHSCSGEDGSGT
jgi:uncharacterized protein (DUF4415 family)